MATSCSPVEACFYVPLHFKRILLTILTCPPHILTFKNRYELRISESHGEVEQGVALSLGALLGDDSVGATLRHCNCNAHVGDCLNMSVCAATTGSDAFTVIAWNPQGQAVSPYLALPVSGPGWSVSHVHANGTKSVLPAQVSALDERTLKLPLLYLNSFKMDAAAVAAAQRALSNNATHSLAFQAALPPLGWATFHVAVAKVGAPGAASLANPSGAAPGAGEFILCTVTFCANPADDLTCSPSYIII